MRYDRLARSSREPRRHDGRWLVVALLASCSLIRAAHAQQHGTIEGWVREAGGAPVHGAIVEIAGRAAPARTDAAGRFLLGSLAPGSITVRVRRLGYEPARAVTMVSASAVARITIHLEPTATTLAAVQVTARPEPFAGRLAGLEERRERGAGHFIGRERIEQTTSRSLVDLLRTAPGVRIVRGGSGQPFQVLRFRGSRCAPLMYIDGVPASAGEFDLGMIDVQTLEAIELYPSQSSIPPEFLGPRGLDRCGVIAVWSRPHRPRQRSGATQQVEAQTLVAAGEVYPADSVDVVARLVEQSTTPVFPQAMWREGKGGHVVAEFVVDTRGTVETNTIVIVTATSQAFADAVREALTLAEFTPAVRRGRRVRQVVHQPFDFIARSPSHEARPPSPERMRHE